MDVVGIDYPVMDFLISTSKLPESNGGSMIQEYSWQCGGKVSSALAALGRLGAQAGIVGIVGNDPYGRFCEADFIRQGVDTSRLITDEYGSNCFCLCIAEQQTHGRSLLGYPQRLKTLTVADLDEAYIRSARFLHLSSISEAVITAAQWVRESGGKVVFDADHYRPEIADQYGLIDIFIASEYYYDAVAQNRDIETTCRSIQQQGPDIVLFTLGENGCAGVYGQTYFTMPAFTVDVRDTTGAGDVFHGAFIYGLLQDWDVEKTARFASAVSAIKCTRMGGRAALPSLETVDRFLRDGTIDYSEIDRRVAFYQQAFFDDPTGRP